jgi:hypothetical protein
MNEEILFPVKLTGETFYNEILPFLYEKLIHNKGKYSFNLSNTTFADPEGIVNFFCISAITKLKTGEIPKLILPKDEKILKFFENYRFFSVAKTPGSEILDFVKLQIYPEYKEKPLTKISGVFSYSNNVDLRQNVDSLLNLINKYFILNVHELFYVEFVLYQTIRNIIEHNFENHPILSCGYFMAQRTPKNSFEFVLSDYGKGYRQRIIEMIKDNKDEQIEYFKQFSKYLLDDRYLFENSRRNPNFIAIQAALNFRKDYQTKPGLYQIMEFVSSLGGELSLHSENIKVTFFNPGKYKYYFYNTYYNGCHIKIEIPLKSKNQTL